MEANAANESSNRSRSHGCDSRSRMQVMARCAERSQFRRNALMATRFVLGSRFRADHRKPILDLLHGNPSSPRQRGDPQEQPAEQSHGGAHCR